MTNTCVTLDSFHRVSNTLIWPSKEFLNPCLINEKKESQSYKWELLHLLMIMSASEVGRWFFFNNFKCLLMLNLWKPLSLPSVTCFLYWPVVAAITPYCPLSFLCALELNVPTGRAMLSEHPTGCPALLGILTIGWMFVYFHASIHYRSLNNKSYFSC